MRIFRWVLFGLFAGVALHATLADFAGGRFCGCSMMISLPCAVVAAFACPFGRVRRPRV